MKIKKEEWIFIKENSSIIGRELLILNELVESTYNKYPVNIDRFKLNTYEYRCPLYFILWYLFFNNKKHKFYNDLTMY